MKLLLVILTAIFFSSCRNSGINGSGEIITQERIQTKEFTKVEVNQGIHLVVEQSDEKSVVVEADDNIVEHITTRVENGTLIIEANEGFNTETTPEVIVKMPIIAALTSNSGANITSNNDLITDHIEVSSTSGSEINITVEADFIHVESTSGSSITVSGKALKLETTSTSGSEINADRLISNEVYAETESGSSTSVDPILKLEAHASSGSSIQYKTTPKALSKEESSGGSVSSL